MISILLIPIVSVVLYFIVIYYFIKNRKIPKPRSKYIAQYFVVIGPWLLISGIFFTFNYSDLVRGILCFGGIALFFTGLNLLSNLLIGRILLLISMLFWIYTYFFPGQESCNDTHCIIGGFLLILWPTLTTFVCVMVYLLDIIKNQKQIGEIGLTSKQIIN